ncbi:UbiA family prenyltransferase [Anaeromyxobacter oryzisoli]|uniref:UbiA family prenyltransferase n=1 Tax=Anaeromyxobacter oryzisoli TaxID=2925408 RepID=UPI001F581AEA|nr:UbiA family prenyltransferase [Anaeromyxobacter sp. SG63]
MLFPTSEPSPAPGTAPASLAARLGSVIQVLRLHQWAKNLLVFAPVVAAHRFKDADSIARATLAFLAFGAAASAGYVVNDLRDVGADRAHPRKRARPIAAGTLPAPVAVGLVPLLFAAAAALSSRLPSGFRVILAGYVAATLAYSFGLKRRPMLDVLLLAGLYTARLFAGGEATGTPVSEWLASFSMFAFLSLALLKRTAELARSTEAPVGRGYQVEERTLLTAMGVAAAFVSVLVLALYLSSEAVVRLYSHPRWLWLLCPIFLYWLARLWLLAVRGEMDDDPVLFALRDVESLVVAAAASGVLYKGL